MADKQEVNYEKLLKRLEIESKEFFMIGNSLKSDVLPVLGIGGYAVHVPYHTTWEHEKIHHKVDHPNFITVDKISDVLEILL
jgi:putative hydrolase of the HAD superfamily